MSRGRREKKEKKNAERLLQEAFGVSDEQLFNEFILAQTEVKDSEIPPEPEDGFERLMAKLEQEVGAESSVKSDPIKFEEHVSIHKPRRLKTILKVSLAAAVVAVLVGATGISAGAKREYRYVVREKDNQQKEKILNNVEVVLTENELEEAYEEIENKIQIHGLRFAYLPSKMKYIKTDIEGKRAIMYFEYGKYRVKVVQQIKNVGTSISIVSDREVEKSIFNDLLNEKIDIEKSKIEKGVYEYSACFIKRDTYYQISGVMPKNEFIKIIENLYLQKY